MTRYRERSSPSELSGIYLTDLNPKYSYCDADPAGPTKHEYRRGQGQHYDSLGGRLKDQFGNNRTIDSPFAYCVTDRCTRCKREVVTYNLAFPDGCVWETNTTGIAEGWYELTDPETQLRKTYVIEEVPG